MHAQMNAMDSLYLKLPPDARKESLHHALPTMLLWIQFGYDISMQVRP